MRRSRIAFDRFQFDSATGELWRDGARVPLQPQPARLLELLVARSGEVVTRDEIRAALWGSDVHVDFDRSLNFCVAKLRTALDDAAAAPRFIETVPTRGYRFIAAERAANTLVTDGTDGADTTVISATECTDHTDDPKISATERAEHADAPGVLAAECAEHADAPGILAAECAEHADAMGTSAAQRAKRADPARHTRHVLTAVVVLVLAVAIIVARIIYMPAGTPKVVVVPFHNETGSAELDRLAKGVSDATVARLAESDRLRVIGNASGLTFSFRPPDMRAMGQSLGAQYLVLGQMKRDDRVMRIVAHLIRVSDQTHVWAHTYDTDMLDLSQQSSIADAIARAVAVWIVQDVMSRR